MYPVKLDEDYIVRNILGNRNRKISCRYGDYLSRQPSLFDADLAVPGMEGVSVCGI